jgi:hypothetical protein
MSTKPSGLTDNLYLSSFAAASEYNVLNFKINFQITVYKEVPKLELNHVESIKLDVFDKPAESLFLTL